MNNTQMIEAAKKAGITPKAVIEVDNLIVFSNRCGVRLFVETSCTQKGLYVEIVPSHFGMEKARVDFVGQSNMIIHFAFV